MSAMHKFPQNSRIADSSFLDKKIQLHIIQIKKRVEKYIFSFFPSLFFPVYKYRHSARHAAIAPG